MRRKRVVAIGLLGTNLDKGSGKGRWEHWRPTVSLCQQEDLLLDRLELLADPRYLDVARTVAEDIARIAPETKVHLTELAVTDPWDLEEMYGALHDFARDYRWRPEEEEYLVHITTGTHVAQICLFLLSESRHFPARLVQTSPSPGNAPPGRHTIIDLDLSRYDHIASRFRREQKEGLSFLKAGIDTRNAAFNRMMERIEQVAIASRAPLLLTGPTGAGKSQLARRIFQLKEARRQVSGELVEVNCATLRGDAAMSALFGHTRGAFTGALRDRPGLLKKADGGVMFLDEIGELGLDEQAMLLRAIEEKTFLPLGADAEVRSDFQLIAGTNRELRVRVAEGCFRADLLARIDLWTFRLPGLAERREDIEPNLDFELERVTGTLGRRVTMNREARARFVAFATSPRAPWAGNFRELNAAVVRMSTLAENARIDARGVEEEIARLEAAWASDAPPRGAQPDPVVAVLGAERAQALDRFDRAQLADVLEACRSADSLSAAGRALFQSSRATKRSTNDADRLRKYLARHGLEWSQVR